MRALRFLALFGTLAGVFSSSVVAAPKSEATPVTLEQLASFPVEMGLGENPPPTKLEIPAEIRALDGKRITIKGYLIPLEIEGGRVRQAVLLRDLMSCCYGTIPALNSFVLIDCSQHSLAPTIETNVPVTLVGTLKVGEIREQDFLVGLYRLSNEPLPAAP
ncbi:MAG TPA: DUF3299 domain-containing protein [Opitutaceae bacterium]|nr:DUF3299 domain-containing protein [Opitutaceae bacterium]